MYYEGTIDAFMRGSEIDPELIFTPREFSGAPFLFRNETTAAMSDAELSYVRLDEQSTRYPYGSALRRCLSNLEAISTICVDGVKPDLRTMFLFETLRLAEQDGKSSKGSLDGIVPDKEHNAALAAMRYSAVLQKIASSPTPIEFSPQSLLDLHRELLYEPDEDVDVRFRKRACRIAYDPEDLSRSVYFPPPPERIEPLIEDLMKFCNQKSLSPVTQAAVAHFHLEAIRPFKTGMDRTGRAFVHSIIRSRGFYKHIIPPIALVPAMNVPRHAELLFPYRLIPHFTTRTAALALDRWVAHCAHCTKLSVDSALMFMTRISKMEGNWYKRIGDVRAGSAIDMLLRELPGLPLITVASAMSLTGKGFSASNEAVNQLVSLGILRPLNGVRRNRCFEAPEVINFLASIQKEAIPTELVARESVFRE